MQYLYLRAREGALKNKQKNDCLFKLNALKRFKQIEINPKQPKLKTIKQTLISIFVPSRNI